MCRGAVRLVESDQGLKANARLRLESVREIARVVRVAKRMAFAKAMARAGSANSNYGIDYERPTLGNDSLL